MITKCTKCPANAVVAMQLKDPKTGVIERTLHHCPEHFFMFCVWMAKKHVEEKISDVLMVVNAKRD